MVIMGPKEYCTTILVSKPSQNLSYVSLLEPGILACKLPWVFSKCKILPDIGKSMKDNSFDHIMHAFPFVWCPGFMVVTPSFKHLSITFSNQRFSNCSCTMEVGFMKVTSDIFCGNRVNMNIQF
jgi:hypothetical protein